MDYCITQLLTRPTDAEMNEKHLRDASHWGSWHTSFNSDWIRQCEIVVCIRLPIWFFGLMQAEAMSAWVEHDQLYRLSLIIQLIYSYIWFK